MRELSKKQRLKIIKENIEWYKVGSPVAKAMIHFGELGFSFCGHGCGFGGEDFGLIRKDLCPRRQKTQSPLGAGMNGDKLWKKIKINTILG